MGYQVLTRISHAYALFYHLLSIHTQTGSRNKYHALLIDIRYLSSLGNPLSVTLLVPD